ncbi:MAG: RHS repeat-associated core domain-containing protein, partial [Phycisphaerales bacterium JB038]
MLGNWVETQVDLGFAQAGDYGTYTDTNDLDEDRTHNDANEIDERTINLGDDIIHTYDDAGNLRFAGIEGTVAGTRYTHDAWNRLVRIETIEDVGGSQGVPAVPDEEFEYNGLNWRTLRQIRKEYTSPMQFTGQQSRRFYYTPSWQLIEERLDDADAAGDDRYAQQFWGVRYIDDAIHRRVATKSSYDTEGEFTDDESYFYITNVQFSTVAMLGFPDTPGDHPELIERVRYDSYGTARHIDPYDINGNGTNFDAADKSRASAATPSFPDTETPITASDYDVDVDLDFDGAVGIVEGVIASSGTQAAGLPAGQVSDPDGIDNPIGYDGYVFNDSVELYTVRHRHYDTRQGRWLERDPLGYTDGLSLYAYVASAPRTFSDPLGLWKWKGGKRQGSWRAIMIAEPGDTTGTAAVHAGLQESESGLWLMDLRTGEYIAPGTPINEGCPYSVPNTVYVTLGDLSDSLIPFQSKKKDIWGNALSPGVLRAQSRRLAKQFEKNRTAAGYKVVYQEHASKQQILFLLQSPDITGLFFTGHGAEGVIFAYDLFGTGDSLQTGITAGEARSVQRHRLSQLVLVVCDAGQGSWNRLLSDNAYFYRAACGTIRPTLMTSWRDVPLCSGPKACSP